MVLLAVKIVQETLPPSGLYAVAALSGLVDVDAVTLATARMTATGLDLTLGANAVLLAAAVDSASKPGIAAVVGGRRLGLVFGLATLAAVAAAGAALCRLG